MFKLKVLICIASVSCFSLCADEVPEEVSEEVETVSSSDTENTEITKKNEKGEKGEVKENVKNETEELDQIQRERYEPRISNKWFRGSYLIYDCEVGNFACVNKTGLIRCERERDEDKKESKPQVRCAYFKKFATQEDCFKEQYRQIQNQKPRVYCMNPKYF